MQYNKLVRDKVPEIMAASGKKARIHTADALEYARMLDAKLTEEVNEYLKDGDTKELADLVDVVYAILDLKKISKPSFETLRENKIKARGGFSKRIILESDE